MPSLPLAVPKKKNRGFSSTAKNFGYRKNKSGKFTFQIPKLSKRAEALSERERILTLADFNISNAEMARRLDINETTAKRWRTLLSKTAQERPSLMKKLVDAPLSALAIGREYDAHGVEWVRLKYELSNVGMRGLIVWLRVGRYIDGESTFDKQRRGMHAKS